jgi:protocatechuate 3,4-dioxygenase beta subunit
MPRRRAADSLCLLVILLWSAASSAMSLSPRGPKAAQDRRLSVAITGVVVDEQGKPVANAEVEATAEAWVPGAGQRTRTNAAGRFLIPSLQERQTYVLRASRAGFAPALLSVTPYGTTAEYWLTLHGGATASGWVIDDAGRPVPGARVSLSRKWKSTGDPPYGSTSGPDGRFEIPDLPAERFELSVRHRDFPSLSQSGIVIPPGSRRVDLGRVALPKGERLRGQVFDSQGRPLAEVRLWPVYDRQPDLEPAAVTGPDGRFEIARFGRFGHLFFCRTGYQSHVTLFLVPSNAARLSRIVLDPAQPLAQVSGRVIDDTGRPVPGARVRREARRPSPGAVAEIRNPCREPEPSLAIADARGRFTFALPGSSYTDLWAEAAGHLRGTRTGVPFGPGRSSGSVEIVLPREATVAGKILAPDGSPVAGVRVYASQDGKVPEAVTDARGRYRLTAVEPGARELRAEHPDRGQARRRLDLAPGMNRLDLTLDGQRERAVAGRVVGPDGEPLAGVRVEVPGFSTYSDVAGKFRLVFPRGTLLLLPDVLDLQANRVGYSPGHHPIKPSETPIEGLEIRLEPGRILTGRILGVEPERLADVEIRAEQGEQGWSSGVVSPDGTYRIDDLEPGPWSVSATLENRMARETVEAATTETTLDLNLSPLREVRGKVLGPSGEPIAGAFIQFLDTSLSALSASSGEDGTFSLPFPEGTHTIEASARSHDPTLQDELVTLAAPTDGLEIRLKRGHVLRGRILNLPDGADAYVSVSQGLESHEADAAPNGTYLVPGLGPGEWKVEALVRMSEITGEIETGKINQTGRGRISLAPGAAEAVLDLDLSFGDLTLSGHLLEGEGLLSTRVALLRADGEALAEKGLVEDEENGNFRFPGLQPGRYILKIEDYYRDRVLLRPVDLRSDREVTIDLEEEDR